VSGGGRRFLNIKGKFFPTGKRYATEIHLDGTYHSRMIADASWAEQGAIVFIESKRGMVIATEVYGSAVTVQTSKGGDYVRLVRTVQLVSADIAMPGVDMFIQTYKVPKTLDTVTMFFEGETFLGMTDLDCSYLVEKDPITITDLTPGHMGDKRELQVQQNTALIALHWDKRYEKFSQLKRVVSLIPHPDLLPFQKGEGEKKGRVYADN
jgi:hypothetical protein